MTVALFQFPLLFHTHREKLKAKLTQNRKTKQFNASFRKIFAQYAVTTRLPNLIYNVLMFRMLEMKFERDRKKVLIQD